ncbi:hypothetical protein [Streptomyces sp. NBC_00620]|uniref:hypothetical protein n=1 Tax=Streptomyces sp. NBC_00620 TaxID=2903666 RepID=UPI002251E6D2|nr:hypothetical protein [Streptomyces sp. NBC_00620]MCX4971409.1 hypothetical protein [Streptomyces sp. NBC_00620]
MNHGKGVIDLIAFIAVLGTGITLLLTGTKPESLAVIVISLTGLYQAYLHIGPRSDTKDDESD